MKRPSHASMSAMAHTGFPDADFLTKFKTIAEYLSTAQWDDGKPRELSSLTLCLQGVAIQVALNDKAMGRSCYTTAGTLEEALELMDEALREDTIVWRLWKRGGNSGK